MIKLKDSMLKNQKIIISAVIGICVILADFYFVIKPVIGGLAKVLPEVSTKVSRINIIDVDVKNIPNYENQIKNLESQLLGYKRKFSTKEEISPLLTNLSNTAKACNVKIISINPFTGDVDSQAKSQASYRKFPIFLSAASSYHSFGIFLSKLENSSTFMRVTDIKILGDATGDGNHKFDTAVVTYILGPKEEGK